MSRPLGKHPTIVMLRGSLSPQTSIVKLSVTEQRNLQLRGPAVIFENALDAQKGSFTATFSSLLHVNGP